MRKSGRASRSSLTSLVLAFALVGTVPAGCSKKEAPGNDAEKTAPSSRPKSQAGTHRTYSAKLFYKTTSFGGSSFSADERSILLTSDETGIFNVYRQPVDGRHPRIQLTRSKSESTFGLAWFPRDNRFIYRSDQGGNELHHLYVMEQGGAKDITPGKKLRARFLSFSGDDQYFWVLTNERNPKFFDLYRYETRRGYKRTRVFTNTGGWLVSAVSRDGRYLALAKVRNNADSDIFVQRLGAQGSVGKPKKVTPHKGNAQHLPQTFTPDSQELYYLTDKRGEFMQAWAYNLKTRKHRPVIRADWDVIDVYFSKRGRYRVSAINADARTVISVLDTKTGKPISLPKLPGGAITGVSISRSETKLAFYVNGDTSPSNLYVLELGRSAPPRRLTNSLNPQIRQSDLVEGKIVRYPSFDGRKIPAILFRPKGATRQNRAPALVWVHGGPGGQTRKGYRATLQHLINHGYAILAVNNRGSTGYGKTFFHLDDRKHGDVDLKDCVYGRRYLEGLPWVNGKRVGIIGGSYGGYMTVAALAFAPKAFDIGIDIFGVTNWLRTLTKIPPWWTAFRDYLYAELGDPRTDAVRLKRISPLFHAKNIVRPLLVVQGRNDPRVLKVESDEIVAAARKNGVPVEYLVFDDEGHGFTKRKNRIAASEAFLRFANKHLRK